MTIFLRYLGLLLLFTIWTCLFGFSLKVSAATIFVEPVVSNSSDDTLYVSYEYKKLRFRGSYETLNMQGEPDLGMLGMGADLFLFDALPQFYATLNSYSAILGNRPGLITFGTGLGWHQPLANGPISVDAGVFVGGGGGGGAPDGGGLITRAHLQLQYDWRNLSLFAGYSRLDFPTGDMGSHNLQIGLSYSSLFTRAKTLRQPIKRSPFLDPLNNNFSNFRITLGGQNYLKFSSRPTHDNGLPEPKANDVFLVGIELDHFLSPKWYATLKLHGAMAGGIDGYMSYLVGMGVEERLFGSDWKWDAQVVAGPSGGGNVATGGGALVQGGIGLRKGIGSDYEVKLGLGQTWTPRGSFGGSFVEVGVSKGFEFVAPVKGPEKTTYGLSALAYKQQVFDIAVMNRTYFTSGGFDKSGNPYDRAFQLLGFTFAKRLNSHFEAVGATFWAYQGSYGAYAEGLLGVGYLNDFSPTWQFKLQGLMGAAGGGGIDLGSGLVVQYQAALKRSLSENWSMLAGLGQMRGLRGNFKPLTLDVGLVYHLEKTQKRHK